MTMQELIASLIARYGSNIPPEALPVVNAAGDLLLTWYNNGELGAWLDLLAADYKVALAGLRSAMTDAALDAVGAADAAATEAMANASAVTKAKIDAFWSSIERFIIMLAGAMATGLL